MIGIVPGRGTAPTEVKKATIPTRGWKPAYGLVFLNAIIRNIKVEIRGNFLRKVPRISLQSLFFSSQKEYASAGRNREVSVRLIALLQGAQSIR